MYQERNEAGFSYVDVMIAVTILLVGVMAMLSAITSGIVMTTTSQQQLSAKQYAQSTIESIFSARDIETLGFDAIGNVGDTSIPGGVFLSGRRAFGRIVGAICSKEARMSLSRRRFLEGTGVVGVAVGMWVGLRAHGLPRRLSAARRRVLEGAATRAPGPSVDS